VPLSCAIARETLTRERGEDGRISFFKCSVCVLVYLFPPSCSLFFVNSFFFLLKTSGFVGVPSTHNLPAYWAQWEPGPFLVNPFLAKAITSAFFLSTGTIIWDFLNNRVSRFFFQIMDRQRSCTVQEIKLSSEFNQVCEQLAAGAVEEGDRYLLAST
jgi:hypothetical protein